MKEILNPYHDSRIEAPTRQAPEPTHEHPTRKAMRNVGRLLTARDKLRGVSDLIPSGKALEKEIKDAMKVQLDRIREIEGLS